jgi:hypothetical protein
MMARAIVNATTRVAPAAIKDLAASLIVLPEVITSSHTSTACPLIASGRRTPKAPCTDLARSFASIPIL